MRFKRFDELQRETIYKIFSIRVIFISDPDEEINLRTKFHDGILKQIS